MKLDALRHGASPHPAEFSFGRFMEGEGGMEYNEADRKASQRIRVNGETAMMGRLM